MAERFPTDFTESDSRDDEFLEAGSGKTLASKDLKVYFDPDDEGQYGSHLGENPPRKGSGWKPVETYKLKDICEDDDLTNRLQGHGQKFMKVGGSKSAKQKDTNLEHWKLQSKKLQSIDK